MSRNQAVIVEYSADDFTDLFQVSFLPVGRLIVLDLMSSFLLQIGRSSESPIDFVVMDTIPGNRSADKVGSQSTISRFACRIIANRENLSASIFAAGFDSSRNIFLGIARVIFRAWEDVTRFSRFRRESDQVGNIGPRRRRVNHQRGVDNESEGCFLPRRHLRDE